MDTSEGFEKRWVKFLAVCGNELDEQEQSEIRKAFDFQQSLLVRELAEDAELAAKPSYKVACIIINEINLRRDAVVASILLHLIDYGLEEEVRKSDFYTGAIKTMLEDGLKIRRLHTDKIGIHTENFIKLILTISADIRVILVELAWVLYSMRRYKKITAKQQQKILPESKLLYAPIAHRLGLYAIKTELEDLWLKFSQEQTYKDIARKLDETKRDRERFIAEFIAPIRNQMDKAGIDCEIKGRPKSIHSIWNKMQKQGVGFDKVYDKFAIRVIIDNVAPEQEKPFCWNTYSYVTEHYKPFPKRLRDWISAPKSSGYESLHTTVETPSGKWVEVQIRTRRMDDIAEKGQAAHWKYKESGGESGLDDLLGQMRSALEKSEEERDADQAAIKDALYEKEIFVFTPTGDLKKLRAKSTVLDFAFSIHTNVGALCKGANVNNKYVTNKQVLENGDTVEIVTAKSVKASPSWLNIVVSPRARTKVKRLLKEQKYTFADLGKEMLHFKLKQWKIDKWDEAQNRLMKNLDIATVMELFDAIAHDKIDLNKYKSILIGEEKETKAVRTNELAVENTLINRSGDDPLVIEKGKFSMEYSMAKCCNPIPGDEIFGFVSVKQGVKIHKLSCPNARDLLTRYAYRVIPARWAEAKGKFGFLTTLRISGDDSQGLVNDITKQVLDAPEVLLKAIEAKSLGKRFVTHLTVEVSGKEHLDALIARINRLQGVDEVYRPT